MNAACQRANANICLVFKPENGRLFTKLAEQNFSSVADGYCLKHAEVLPHVTLCQTHIACDSKKYAILQALKQLEPAPKISLFGIHSRFASPYMWVEFIVTNTEPLHALMMQATELIESERLQPLSKVREFFHPHVTLARIRADRKIPSLEIPSELSTQSFETKLALGRSDGNGQLLSETF